MIQCIDSLRTLIHERIRVLKRDKYLANADWAFIAQSFRIENPYLNKYLIDNDDSLLTHLKQNEYEDLVEEGRIRLINIQKVVFSEQEGIDRIMFLKI